VEKSHQELLNAATAEKEKIKKQFARLKKGKSRVVDDLFHGKHVLFFEKNNCLSCANCCKTTSPIFRDVDVKRISKHLKIKETVFVDTYLRVDEDGDHVLKSTPCSFLDQTDNTCSIYDFRPLACAEYPHTNRKNMIQILDLTLRNTEICPAVASMALEIGCNK
jgi:Fe-S-cluster containining protein